MATSEKTWFLNADKTKAVEEDAEDAAFLLVRAGGEIEEEELAKYGLSADGSKVDAKAAAKAQAELKTKAAEDERDAAGMAVTQNKQAPAKKTAPKRTTKARVAKK